MLHYININDLYPHPNNPRKNLGELAELAESIKSQGVLQNLTVVPWNFVEKDKSKWDDDFNRFVVIIGHRRLAASKLAGLTELPCTITEMDERTQIATMLLENIQRVDLTIQEQAEGFQMMLDLGESVTGISDKTGFSETTVRHRINLMKLDKSKFLQAVERGGSMQDYIALEKLQDPKRKNKMLEYIGTKDFDWQLKNAIDEEAMPERKKALIALLDGWAKPLKKDSSTNGLSYEKQFWSFKSDDFKKPKDAETAEYFYKIDPTTITLYKKEPKASPKKKDPKEKAYIKREAQLKEITQRAFELRQTFIKDFNAWQKHSQEIRKFAIRGLMSYGCAEKEAILTLCNVEIPKFESSSTYEAKIKKMLTLINEQIASFPERSLFIAAYCKIGDKKDNRYYSAYSWEFKLTHNSNTELDAIYDCLITLGYEMSAEEQQLRDGTHELFDKKGK